MILYFKPKTSAWEPPKHLTVTRDVQAGPGGENGKIYTNGKGRTGYYPDDQVWDEVAIDKADSYWLGIDGDTLAPADLERDELIAGHLVTLEDGHDWLIPVARCFPAGTNLPEALILGPGGELVSEILPRFAKFAGDAERVYEALGDGEDMSLTDGWDIAVRALSLNYHLDRHEVSFLKLLTTTNMTMILRAIIDYPTIEVAIERHKKDKKKESLQDSDSSSDGSGA
jgi:hypothetical protein